MSFDTTRKTLKDLLAQIEAGKLQLPEFQRDFERLMFPLNKRSNQ
jgi:uncharacterized protein with ParB-like and HNH nuclease domain